MKTFFEFIQFLFSTLGEVVKVAASTSPVLLVSLVAILLIGIIVLRKKLKALSALIFILFFALLFVQVPGFILQYKQHLAGTLSGSERDIELLNELQIKKEISSALQIEVIKEDYEKRKKVLEKLTNAGPIKIYGVFFFNLNRDFYEGTLKNYVPVIALDNSGYIAMGIGGSFGFLLWLCIYLGIRRLFKKKKEIQS